MPRFFLAVVLLIVVAACNNSDDNNDLLEQQPYAQLTDSIGRLPGNADLYYRRGSLLFRDTQFVFAEKDLRTAWLLDPREEYALSMTTVLRQKHPDSAIAFLQEALKKLPGNVSLQVALARGYQQKGQTAQALAVCDELLRQYPGQLDALSLRSELLKEENKPSDALATLEKAHAYAPADVELAHQLAFEYAEAGNSKALALADSLIRADVRNVHAEPYYFKGVYYSNTGNAQEAIKQFDAAIRHNYHFLNAYINKGIVYYDQKKYDQALKTFDFATTVFPAEADPYYWLGKTQEATGNKPEAKLNYLRAFGLDKTMTEAKEAADKL